MYPVALEAGLVLCWSSGFIGAVLASQTSSIYLVLFWRFLVASILLAPFIIPYLKRQYLPAIMLQTVVGVFAMFAYLAMGVKAIDVGVPPGTAALIASLQPLATAALVGPILGETVSKRQWFGLCFGLGGVVLAVSGGLGSAPVFGYFLSFASMMSIVIATLISKRSTLDLPLMPTLGVHCLVSAILFLAIGWAQGAVAPEWNVDFWYAVIWFVLFSTVGAYGLYWLCLKRMKATRVASLIYFTPPVTMVWAWLMFGEAVHLSAVGGFLLCIVGVLLARGARQNSV